jgi:hypothetical protein
MPSGTETSRPPVSTTRDELLYRLRQQSLLGEFGQSALQTRDVRQIVQRATELCAQGLEAPFAKVLESRTRKGFSSERASDGRLAPSIMSLSGLMWNRPLVMRFTPGR